MARLQLTSDDVEYLRELANVSAGRIYLNSQRRLESAGLITIHTGRYGEYTRITDAGLTPTAGATPASPPQPLERGRQAALHSGIGNPVIGGTTERKVMITAARHIKKHQR